MNSSQVNLTMFNPFDGVNFLTGTAVFAAVGVIVGNNTLFVLAAPLITGIFMVLCKVIEIAYKARADKRLRAAREEISELKARLNGEVSESPHAKADVDARAVP